MNDVERMAQIEESALPAAKQDVIALLYPPDSPASQVRRVAQKENRGENRDG